MLQVHIVYDFFFPTTYRMEQSHLVSEHIYVGLEQTGWSHTDTMIIHWDQSGGLQQPHLIYKSNRNMKTHLIITGAHKQCIVVKTN